MTRPNFFIVGAPKCGTTALAAYLADHPEVFVSNPKEPQYFLHPAASNRKIVDERHYLSLFSTVSSEKAVGEASVFYLYSEHARQEIKKFCPNAKIIILKRNPVDFVASFHSQLLFSGYENCRDLADAWHQSKGRVLADDLDSLEQAADWINSYPEMIRFEKYIDKYVSDFGEENVLVMAQEELLANMRGCYLQTLAFLGVDDDGRQEFPKVNVNKVHKNEYVRHFLHFWDQQEWAVAAARKVKSLFGIGSFGIYKFVSDLNLVNVKRPAVPEDLRNDILAYYESMNGDV